MQSATFKRTSVFHLREYLLRLKKATEQLSHDQIWWKPHYNTISIGNILKHLNGNVTQWIISGLGGKPDLRNRSTEFDNDTKLSKETLLDELTDTIKQSISIIENISDADLVTPVNIQGFNTSKLAAVYHVVEHFSWHCGQVTWISKMLLGEEHHIAFYDNNKLNTATNI